jgi:hypothetical protein
MGILRLVCSYCDQEYGTKDGGNISGDSHGICPKCAALSDDQLDAIANAKTGKKNAARITSFSDFLKR